MKKYVALLLSLVMVLSLCPVTVFATGYSDWSGGETLSAGTYDLDGATVTITKGTLTVEGEVTVKNGTIKRGSSKVGAIFTVGSGDSLTLEGVTLDGGAVWGGDTDNILGRGTSNSGISSFAPLIDAGGQYSAGGTVVLVDCELRNNVCSTSGEGGAITVGQKGNLTATNTKMYNNAKTEGQAGAIKAYIGATVKLTRCEFYGNKAVTHGGAIQIWGGNSPGNIVHMTMTNCTVSNNKAGSVGGGIAVSDYSDFTMIGGSITDNATTDSSKRGGGVGFADANTSMSLSGSAVITGNTANGAANNLFVGTKDCNKVTVGTMTSGANIGVTMSGGTGVFSTGGASYTGSFKSDNSKYTVVADGGNLKLVSASTDICNVSVYVNNASFGSVFGGGTYGKGESVTLTATPAAQCAFLKWVENDADVSFKNTYTFTADSERSLEAVFTAKVVVRAPREDQVITVKEGEGAFLEIEAENAEGYSWYVDKNDGNGFVEIPDAGSDKHTISRVTLENNGWKYYCKCINDADMGTMSPIFTLQVVSNDPASTPVITTTSLPNGTVGTAYSQTLASNAPSNVTVLWHIVQGNLPDGLTLGTSGVISGTPTKAGTFSFTVVMFDGPESFSDTQELSITIAADGGNGGTGQGGGTQQPADKYKISGTVKQDQGNAPVVGAFVWLMLGKELVADTKTDTDGNYSFGDQLAGNYNIVVTKNKQIVTVLIELTNNEERKIILPEGVTNSIVVHETDNGFTSGTLVGGLDAVAAAVRNSVATDTDVEVKLTVADQKTSDINDSVRSAIKEEALGQELVFFDLSVENTIDGQTVLMSKLNSLLDIRIPFDSSDKKEVAVYRYHDNNAETMRVVNKDSNEEGFWVGDDGYIHIYTQKFSTYAIGYVEKTASSPSYHYPIYYPTGDNTTTKIEPVKTFDGGIALAVGVSILSVTGSAWLLRKKED